MLKPLLRDYAISYIAVLALFFVLMIVLTMIGMDYRPPAQGLITHVCALAFSASRHVQRGGEELSKGKAWQFAFGTVVVMLLIATAQFALTAEVDGFDDLADDYAIDQTVLISTVIGVGLLFVVPLTLLVSRYVFPIFVRMDLRRKAAKKG